MKKRVFLMLQGPQSPFFSALSNELVDNLAEVYKLNLCGGDSLIWLYNKLKHKNKAKVFSYHRHKKHFPLFIKNFYITKGVTDILVYGDWRPFHHEAILIAKSLNINVWVYEEGYLRGSFSTMERDGVNGRSHMMSYKDNIDYYYQKICNEQTFVPTFSRPTIYNKVKYAIIHHVGNVLLFPFYCFYHTHRPHNILVELIGIVPRFFLRHNRKLKSAQTLYKFFKSKAPFYYYPLQLNSDAQVQLYSPYIRQEDTLITVISSFAKHAKEDHRLLIKNHPLDNGLIDYGAYIKAVAIAFNVANRVTYVQDGNNNILINKCKSVVLINSTVGLSALMAGKNVYCLGSSIYTTAGLAYNIKTLRLDDFWNIQSSIDKDKLDKYIKVLTYNCLISGNFYTKEGIAQACKCSLIKFKIGDQNGK